MRAGLGSRGGGSATAASCSTISPCSSSCSMNIINQRGVGLAKLVQAVKQPESSKLQAQPESSKPQPLYTGLQIGTFVPAMLCACAKTTFTGCGASVSCGPRFLLPGSCCSSCKFDGSALSAGCRRFEPLPVFGRFFAGTCNTHPVQAVGASNHCLYLVGSLRARATRIRNPCNALLDHCCPTLLLNRCCLFFWNHCKRFLLLSLQKKQLGCPTSSPRQMKSASSLESSENGSTARPSGG